jgi:HD-like signal output (HDOD) protein
MKPTTKQTDKPGLLAAQGGQLVVPADELKAGMLLADDLIHFNGRLLLGKGTCLTPKYLRILRMWGITEAPILKSGIVAEEPEYFEKEELQVDEDTRKIAKDFFHFADLGHEVNRRLYQLFIQRLTDGAVDLKKTGMDGDKPPEEEGAEPGYGLAADAMDIREKIKKEIKLPSLPTLVVRLNEAINHPSCTATHIADIIVKDSSLAARLLKLVNSAFYSFPTTIESIPRAVTIIGSKQLSELALGTAVISTFKNIPVDVADMKSFWTHNVACGIICRLLASYRKNANTETYFLAGLLHDIGRLILYMYFPQVARNTLFKAYESHQLLHLAEEELTGCGHPELGSTLIKQWRLPPILEYGCRYHHDPMESPDRLVSSIVHIADIITIAMRFGNSGEYFVPPLIPEAWEELGLPASIIPPVIQQTEQILTGTIKTYFGHYR